MTAYRHGKHISDILCSESGDKKEGVNIHNSTNGYRGCGKCMVCSYSMLGNTVKNFATGGVYNINGSFNCNSRNGIYYNWVLNDNKFYPYVGRSTNPKIRFSSHKNHANNYNEAENYNCGLSEFLYKKCGGWLEPSRIKFMIIDGIDDSRIPKNLSKKDRLEWIFQELASSFYNESK